MSDIENKQSYVKETTLLIYNIIAGTILDSFSNFLYMVNNELKNFVDKNDSVKDKTYNNISLMKSILIVLDTPEFNSKWNNLTTVISDKIGLLVKKIDIVVDRDVENILEKLNNMFTKNVFNLIQGTGQASYTAVCAIPPIAPFCEGIDILSTSSKVGSTLFINTIEILEKITNATQTIFGDTALPLAKGVKEIIEFKNFFQESLKSIQETQKQIIG
jgi:hypothetical protein